MGRDGTQREGRPNLAEPLSTFIGREQELAEVQRLLVTTRLLTLTGTGGVGKTRLAARAANDVVGEYNDGVCLVELAPLSDPGLVHQTVAAALDVRVQLGQTPLDALRHRLVGARMLLVLDNCERLLEACARLCTLILQECPAVRVLATSREALGIPGEVTWSVPVLELPDSRPMGPPDLLRFDSVRLFMDRATAARPSFT